MYKISKFIQPSTGVAFVLTLATDLTVTRNNKNTPSSWYHLLQCSTAPVRVPGTRPLFSWIQSIKTSFARPQIYGISLFVLVPEIICTTTLFHNFIYNLIWYFFFVLIGNSCTTTSLQEFLLAVDFLRIRCHSIGMQSLQNNCWELPCIPTFSYEMSPLFVKCLHCMSSPSDLLLLLSGETRLH